MEINIGRNDYYEILELKSSASHQEVNKAYIRAKSTYSGENPAIYTMFSENEARELLRLIEEAYAVVGNRTLRAIYDQRLHNLKNYASDDLSAQVLSEESKKQIPRAIPKPITKPKYTVKPEMEEEILRQVNWSGEFLKKVREYKGFTLETMQNMTKINSYYLDALEKMDKQNLPATVFIRGYVIQVSRALNLDDKKVADSYMNLLKAKV